MKLRLTANIERKEKHPQANSPIGMVQYRWQATKARIPVARDDLC